MYVKRFRGATVSEALALARKELGEDALLLGTGKPADASLGSLIEVTVAAERPRPMTAARSRSSATGAAAVASQASAAGPAVTAARSTVVAASATSSGLSA